MSVLRSFNFFPYQWSYEDVETNNGWDCIIRIFGWNSKNESVYVEVDDFPIPIYIELPECIEWTEESIEVAKKALLNLSNRKAFSPCDIVLEYRQRSYYAHVEKAKKIENGIKYTHKKFPFLCAYFSSMKSLEYFSNTLRKEIYVPGMGKLRFKCHCHNRNITPVLKFIGINQLPSTGWIKCKGVYIPQSEKTTTKKHEYKVSYEHVRPMPDDEAMRMPIVHPKVLSFDCEMNSTIMSSMPKATRPGDVTFQIGVTVVDPNISKNYKKYLLTLGECNPIEGVIVKSYGNDEADLYASFTKLVQDEDPDIIIGFNIMKFDIPYMIDRCEKMCRCMSEFDLLGAILGKHAKKEDISWSSSAYGNQQFTFLNAEGRLFIDMLPCVQRNYKLPNYRLETICEEFLKTNKDPLKPKDIFKCWKQKTPESLALVGKYCVQDANVTLMLYEKLLIWADLSESATVNSVPAFDMFTKGQQIKLYSQLFRYCWHNNKVMEADAYIAKDNERYTGAFVSEPIKGLYDKIVPFDFASLYPNTMRAYNIDYSKLVIDPSIPDDDCHVMIWSEHICCKCPKDKDPTKKPKKGKDGKDVRVCADYKYRWLKHQVSGNGIIPTLLNNLLGARKQTRKKIAQYETVIKILGKLLSKEEFVVDSQNNDEEDFLDVLKQVEKDTIIFNAIKNRSKGEQLDFNKEQSSAIKEKIDNLKALNVVLDRRQNAFKVNANSMYGATGAKKGYAPFLPAAMCVTFMGRTNIMKVNEYIEKKCGGRVIYNDTDSAYCHFPHYKNKPVQELWGYAKQIVKDIKVLFPEELSLEFEEKIYKQFLILTKKRYAARYVNSEGKLEGKLMKRGIILQRRDNCSALRDVYEKLLFKVFEHHEVLVNLNKDDKKSVFNTPEVKEILDMITFAIDSVFQWKYNFRSFVITKQMTKMPNEYKNINKLPSHVLLGAKMQKRGVPIGAGSRIEYVICNTRVFKKTDTQKDKIEDVNYFAEFREIYRISHLDYIKQFINPIDEICRVVMDIDDFVKKQLDIRINHKKVMKRIDILGKAKIVFEDENGSTEQETIQQPETVQKDWSGVINNLKVMFKAIEIEQNLKTKK
jgi:DNA polymerase elongation subunit (family B)